MSAAPLSVCMLGLMAAGKSTFLAGLAILGEPDRGSGLTVRGLNEKSVSYLKELGDTLRLRRWPGPTNVVNLFEIEVIAAGQVLNLLILDYPGDDFRVQLQRFVAGAAEELRTRLAEAEACLLLLDPERELRPESELTDAERNVQIDRLSALVHTVADLRSKRQTVSAAAAPTGNAKAHAARGKSPGLFPDLAVVVTKADLVPELPTSAAAEAFLQRRVPNVLARLQENARHVRCFAVSAVGETERTPEGHVIPATRGRLAPRGYLELFRWLVRRRKIMAEFSRSMMEKREILIQAIEEHLRHAINLFYQELEQTFQPLQAFATGQKRVLEPHMQRIRQLEEQLTRDAARLGS